MLHFCFTSLHKVKVVTSSSLATQRHFEIWLAGSFCLCFVLFSGKKNTGILVELSDWKLDESSYMQILIEASTQIFSPLQLFMYLRCCDLDASSKLKCSPVPTET